MHQVLIESMITNVSKFVLRDILGTLRVDCVYMNTLKMYNHQILAKIVPGINISMSIIKPVMSVTPAVKLAMGNTKLIASLAPEAGTFGLKKLPP